MVSPLVSTLGGLDFVTVDYLNQLGFVNWCNLEETEDIL